MRDKKLQVKVAREVSALAVFDRSTIISDVQILAGQVSRAAAAGQCTGDYVSDLVWALRDLVAAVTREVEVFDALRVQLDAESLGAVAG